MKTKIILIAAGMFAILILAVGLISWKVYKKIVRRPARAYVIAQKRAGAAAAAKQKAPVPKKGKVAKVAIVVDDFGYNMNNVNAFLKLDQPITLSVLPDQPYSAKIAGMAPQHGCEVILHLPLEPHGTKVKEEPDTIRSGMSQAEIVSRLDKEIASVPGITGVSNHMGSKATEDRELMSVILKYLKKRGLYFFDSLTSEKSVCREVAKSAGVKCAKRDIFLDNSNDVAAIEIELRNLDKLARKRGRAIAICHDRKNTVIALAKVMPEMAREGIEFVRLSEMVN